MSNRAHPLARRAFLARSARTLGAALGVSSLGGLAALLGARQAHAADYKALVCVFLYGGNDGMNCVLPTGTDRWAQYSAVRGALALPADRILPLPGSGYALHPALASLVPLWQQGQLAPVFNVGPLVRPLTKAEYLALGENSPARPDGLFSHAQQQALWSSGTGRIGTRTGWGGRASERMGTFNPVISLGGNAPFGLESLRSPLVLPGPGELFGAHGLQPQDLQWTPMRLRKEALDALYASDIGHRLQDAYRVQQVEAFETSDRLAGIVAAQPGQPGSAPGLDAAFGPLMVNGQLRTGMARQLFQVAKLIAARGQVQGQRQMFFASQGGYDTHGDQIGNTADTGLHAVLLRDLAEAMAAFQAAMDNLGLAERVTLFTQSDFGRTFVPNSSRGTDHAWGNHQFVLGGAVQGGQTFGRYPNLEVGGEDDVGVQAWELHGRWLPSASVDQYAATLLRWFGADEALLDAVLPNLPNFGVQRSLDFL